MLQPNSFEPYSSVSFQHKQATSPYPDDNNTSHREAFLNALMERLPNQTTPTFHRRRWRRRRIALLLFLMLLLYLISGVIQVYWAFLRIKLDNALFDRGWIPCGIMRKSPMLYVLDTHQVQLVWEMNCNMPSKTLAVSWQGVDKKRRTVIVEPKVLDDRHVLFKANLGPLKSGEYNYKVESSSHGRTSVLGSYRFRWHAENTTLPIRIAAMGDNQFGLRTFVSVLKQVDKHVDYLLHVGDAVQHYPSLREWETDFVGPLTYYGLGQTTPMIYAHGNHDHDPTYEYHYTRVSPSSDPWFAFSMAGGAIRFVVLDSNLDWEQQDQWLKDELRGASFQEADFRVVVVHVPPFLEYWEPDAWFNKGQSKWSAFVKERYVPLFESFGVDLVISGHQHNYERGQRNGIHYTIIGGAGGDLDFERVHDYGMYESTLLDFHFVLMEFHPPNANYETWKCIWETFDIHGNKKDTITMVPMQRSPEKTVDSSIAGAVDGDAFENLSLDELDDVPEQDENIDFDE